MVGTITYNATSNVVTAVGGTSGAPIGFIDLWNADQAGGWNVVYKQGDSQFLLDSRLAIGDGSTATYFTDTNKHIAFSAITGIDYAYLIAVRANAIFTLGNMEDDDSKSTSSGCSVLFTDTCDLVHAIENGGTVNLYSCQILNMGRENHIFLYSGTAWRIYNTLIYNCYPYAVSGLDLFRVTFQNANTPLYYSTGTMDDVSISKAFRGVFFTETNSLTIKGLKLRVSDFIAAGSYMAADQYLINAVTNTWRFLWGIACTGKVYRQYEFDLQVTDKDNNPIQNAIAKLTDKEGAQVFSATTEPDGNITTQNVTRGYYDQVHESVLQDSTPHTLTITKAGYQTYTKKFVLTEKTRWEIKLSRAQAVLLDLGEPVVNLGGSDPENKLFMRL